MGKLRTWSLLFPDRKIYYTKNYYNLDDPENVEAFERAVKNETERTRCKARCSCGMECNFQSSKKFELGTTLVTHLRKHRTSCERSRRSDGDSQASYLREAADRRSSRYSSSPGRESRSRGSSTASTTSSKSSTLKVPKKKHTYCCQGIPHRQGADWGVHAASAD